MDLPILFTGSNVRAILEGRKTQTRRVPTRGNTFRDGIRASSERWNELDWQSPEIFVDDGPSPAGNPGPYLHVPDKDGDCSHRIYPQWRRGDRLWVRETWWQDKRQETVAVMDADGACKYSSDDPQAYNKPMRTSLENIQLSGFWRKRPSIFMPRWASRILLEVTDVRVQRVQDISEEDAIAEGIREFKLPNGSVFGHDPQGTPGPMVGNTARASFANLWDSINAKRGFGWNANPWVWALTFRSMTEAAK